MFFCDPCAESRKWPISLAQSYGPCEMCGKPALCNDIASSQLPSPDHDHDEQNAIESIKDTMKKREG